MTQTATTLSNLRKPEPSAPVEVGFFDSQSYGLLKSIALDFSASGLVPKQFQGNSGAPNCMIALNMALRMKADPLMVMQNLYIVYERPSWSASFLIACFNQCGRFAPISYKFEGEKGKDNWGCRAVSAYISTGGVIEGPLVTIEIAKAEGWYAKNGSKWKTMPEQMLRYRAAAWMIRSTAPEIGMGFQTSEEVRDTYDMELTTGGSYQVTTGEIRTADTELEPETVETAMQPEKPSETLEPTETSKTNPRAEMEALRDETRKLWESTGRTLQEVEESTGLFLKQWSRATCMKVQDTARNILSSAATPQGAAPEAGEPFEDPFGGGEGFLTCPSSGKQVDELACQAKSCRNGCPAFLE